jgi:DNA repair exonuclease SbcCD ATPase subunit
MLFAFGWATAQNFDSLRQIQISALEQKVQNMKQQNTAFSGQLKELKSQFALLASENESFKLALQQKQQTIDMLSEMVARNSENIQATADSLGIRLQTTDEAVSQNADSLKAKTIWGVVAFILALMVSAVVWMLHSKGQKISDDKIASLKKQADELNEKIVSQFSSEMSELQKIGDALKNSNANTTAEPDHSLVKTLADRITFMEMTLYRMDVSVKGHKQLSKSIAQMKDNLLANGYEIVDMLGKEYNDGMRVTANFIEDEEIETGKQIITGIVKPQINYKGVMIQSAQITVSQN